MIIKFANKIIYFLLLLFMLITSLVFGQSYVCCAQNNNMFEGNNILSSIAMIFALFFIIYLLVIKPQTKKSREHKNLIRHLKIGDEVITTGGIIGVIMKFNQQFVLLELSNNLNIIIQKQAILAALPHGTLSSLR